MLLQELCSHGLKANVLKTKSVFYIAANRGRTLLGFLQIVSSNFNSENSNVVMVSNFNSENSNVVMVFVAGLLALDSSAFLQWHRFFSKVDYMHKVMIPSFDLAVPRPAIL